MASYSPQLGLGLDQVFAHDRLRLRGFETGPVAIRRGLGQGFTDPLFKMNRVLLAIDDQHSMFTVYNS